MRSNVLIVALVGVAVALSACGSEQGSGGGGGGSGGGGTELVIGLPTAKTSFANADFAVAQEKGFFKEQGLTVKAQNFSSGLKVVQAVVAGGANVGASSIEPVLNVAARGQPVSIIGAYTNRLTVAMVTPRSITTPAQLKGKTLGIQDVGAFREIMTRTVLQSTGLQPKDVRYRPVESTGYTGALVGGQIQSGILQQEQAVDAMRKDEDLHVLVDLYQQDPKYFYGTYFVNRDWLAKNHQQAVAFMAAITKAHRFMYANRKETVRIVAAATGFSPDVIDAAYETLLVKNQVFPVNEGLEQDRLQYTVDKLKTLKALTGGNLDLAKVVDRGPAEEAVKKIGGAQPQKGAQ
jgi:ABC-type nitrate/sulfonate/bicarbonate transport system substrate-binding protein